MILNAPFCISARLLPAVKIGKVFISIEFNGDRSCYRYYIDGPTFEHSASDLKSGVGGGSLQSGMESLLSFLGAAAEAYRYRMRVGYSGENEDLFPPEIVEWAYQESDEIDMLKLTLEENPGLIE